jgi:pimeloyl-ACP methyl ester carboxylesterase
MNRRMFVATVAAVGTTMSLHGRLRAQLASGTPAASTGGSTLTDAAVETGYAPVNGLDMYYEIHGAGGVPLVVIHGAFGNTGMFTELVPRLAETRQVIVMDQQAHGRTADIDRPLNVAQMADDTAALIAHLGLEQVDIFGYSMGGGIAFQLAVRHPELVRKLVIASVYTSPAGVYPEVIAGIETISPEVFAGSPMETFYKEIAPNPDDWPTLIEKIKGLGGAGGVEDAYSVPPEAIAAIEAPVLYIIGDSDIVRPEHAVEVFRLLGGGVSGDNVGLPTSQLAILPGTSHVGVMFQTDALLGMIVPFLDAPLPEDVS